MFSEPRTGRVDISKSRDQASFSLVNTVAESYKYPRPFRYHEQTATTFQLDVLKMASTWNPTTTVNRDSISIDDIVISFQRTIRVSDSKEISQLPPGLGAFNIYKVADYASKLPETMAAKGGIFLPMYRKCSQPTPRNLTENSKSILRST